MKKLLIVALPSWPRSASFQPPRPRAATANHDRLPDKWERAHHLSLKVKQAKCDQDHDGLDNRGEFRAKLNPRDSHTDGGGIKDGEENAGTVTSFEGGVLTITLAEGGDLVGAVTADTEIECHGGATASSHDESGGGGDDPAGDDPAGHDTGDDHGDDPAGEDHGEDEAQTCGTDALKAGAKVREAELKISSTGKRFETGSWAPPSHSGPKEGRPCGRPSFRPRKDY